MFLTIRPVDENDIGRWRFHLTAEDKQGQVASDVLEVMVRQYSGSRLVNHEFELTFDFVKWKPHMAHMWEWQVINITVIMKKRIIICNTVSISVIGHHSPSFWRHQC